MEKHAQNSEFIRPLIMKSFKNILLLTVLISKIKNHLISLICVLFVFGCSQENVALDTVVAGTNIVCNDGHYILFVAKRDGNSLEDMVFPLDDLDVMSNLDAACQFCGSQVDYVIVRNPARAPKTRMFDNSPLEKELLDCGAVTITVRVLSEFAKIKLAKLEAEQQRGIPFNEAVTSDELGLDIMARGILQDWLATLYGQYDRIAARLLPTAAAIAIKPKLVPSIGQPAVVKRGAKVNLTE
jgi:hypothetical protein